MITDERKKELDEHALLAAQGQLFGSWMFEDNAEAEHMIRSVFMVLVLMEKDQYDEFLATKPVHVYELMSEAGPRSINGYPMFMSMKSLNAEEFEYLRARARAILEAQQAAMTKELQ